MQKGRLPSHEHANMHTCTMGDVLFNISNQLSEPYQMILRGYCDVMNLRRMLFIVDSLSRSLLL